ncbi:DNA cytosine methyltransferase [uncultured Roseibium sp.]|uniref:DNA cytosine methyltransferase n=1 Tax=uncultured Roseibium sp. TaxID=1936171 RepID=UPI003422646C
MGLGLAEPGFATACYVEIEEYPRSTLIAGQRAGYLHPAPIWDDLKQFHAGPWRGQVDTLLAGYPCQPFSQAGQRKGEADPRHLWPDIERIIVQLGDSLVWCFFENVQGHLTLGLETVVHALRNLDFRVAVGLFSAGETGTPQERQRLFIVAYRENSYWRRKFEADREGRGRAGPAGGCSELDNAASPRCQPARERPETVIQGGQCVPGERCTELADTLCTRLERRTESDLCRSGRRQEGRGPARLHRPLLHPPGPSQSDVWSHVLGLYPEGAPALSLGDLSAFSRYFAALVEAGELSEEEAECRLCRMADGLASRTRGLRLLGNGVHPLAAAYAWRSLSAAHGLGSVDLEAPG